MITKRQITGMVAVFAGAGIAMLLSASGNDALAASNRFRCEYRPIPDQRSKADLDASGLPAGRYSAEITSKGGVNVFVTAAQTAVNGEVSFGFDSHNEPGENLIDPGFIVGLKASARILDSQGNTVFAVANASCRKHN